jgi:uncharacterized protein (DUF4415 family)
MKKQITKAERLARDRLAYHLWRMNTDVDVLDIDLRENVPDAWHTIEDDFDCEEAKVKVTLYLDQSVAKVFRAMGRGYQARINRILQTWIQHRASGLREEQRMLVKRMGEVFSAGKD